MTENLHKKHILDLIKSHQAQVSVIGLGYVGLPLAVGFARVGFRVTGVELNPDKVARINRGENYIQDVNSEELKRLVVSGGL